ncbi:MAG: hypothetical protein AAF702_03305 [Chloroflexota bacterium]
MNYQQLRSDADKLLIRLHDISYDEFADFAVRTGFPESLSETFRKWRDETEQLVQELPDSFPLNDIRDLLTKSKDAMNPRKSIVSPDDFKLGKEYLEKMLKMIQENAKEPILSDPEPEPPQPSVAPKRSAKIFISHYDQEILEEILSVFELLEELAPDIELSNIEPVSRSQLGNFAEIMNRVDIIRECTGAIICYPHEEILANTENTFVKFDLGACMASFPEHIILLHKGAGGELPETLLHEVRAVYFAGGLDLKIGMGLAKEIIKLLG